MARADKPVLFLQVSPFFCSESLLRNIQERRQEAFAVRLWTFDVGQSVDPAPPPPTLVLGTVNIRMLQHSNIEQLNRLTLLRRHFRVDSEVMSAIIVHLSQSLLLALICHILQHVTDKYVYLHPFILVC